MFFEFLIVSLLLYYYFLMGCFITSFLEFKKPIGLFTMIVLNLFFGILLMTYVLDIQHNILTILCSLSTCSSFPIRMTFIILVAFSIIAIVARAKQIRSRYHNYVLNNLFRRDTLRYLLAFIFLFILLAINSINVSLYSKGPHTDTALFLDQARSLVSLGRIYSNVFHPTIPGYYSVNPPHIYVAFYYAQFILFLGPTYEAAKVANIFISLLTVLALCCLAALTINPKASILSLVLFFIAPRLWTFLGFPLNGSEIVAAFEIIALLILLEVLDFKTGKIRILINYFIIGLISYSVLRTRIDYFSLFIPLIIAWHFSFYFSNCKLTEGVKRFLIIFMTYVMYILFLRTSGFATSALIICMYGIVGVLLAIFYFKHLTVRVNSILSFTCLISTLGLINMHVNEAIALSAIESLMSNPLTMITFTKFYSISDFLNRLKIFSAHLIQAFPLTYWVLLIFSVLTIIKNKKYLNDAFKFAPFMLFISLYLVYICVSVIDFPQGFDKHRFFVLSYLLIIFMGSVFITRLIPEKSITFSIHFNLAKAFVKTRLNSKIMAFFLLGLVFMAPIIVYDIGLQLQMIEEPYKIAEQADVVKHLQKAYTWLRANSSQDDIILTRKPFEASWYVERKSIFMPTLPQDYELFKQKLRSYNISYLIVDKLIQYDFRHNEIIQKLYNGKHPDFLKPLLNYKYDSSNVWIYKVIFN